MFVRVVAFLLLGLCARADEEVTVEDAEPPAADPPAADGEPAADMTEEQKAAAYADSYTELQDKMSQLQSLLAAKGEGADPDLKERLASLQKQLGGIGLGAEPEMAPGSNPEFTEFLTGCVTMAMRRAGISRMSTVDALKRVSDDKMSPEQCSKNELWRMVAICVSEFTDKDLENFKSGKYQTLPSAYVAMAKEAKAETAVMEIDSAIWAELKIISGLMVKQLQGNNEATEPAPIWIGMIGAVPFILAIGFLAKKFLEMQNKESPGKKNKLSKEEKRDGKKSK